MLSKLKKSNNEGFTIIEVMIVLAIAGLIILIVLLAVPALQRNGRNTAAKSDAGQLLGYISDFTANNDGAMPVAASSSVASGLVTIAGAASTTPTTGNIQSGTSVSFVSAAGAVTPTPGTITVDVGYKCGTVSGASHTPVASARSVAVIYAIETSGGNLAKCIGS